MYCQYSILEIWLRFLETSLKFKYERISVVYFFILKLWDDRSVKRIK